MQVQSSVRRRLTRATGHGLMMDGLAMLGQPRGESRAERCAEYRAVTVTLRLTGATASSRQGRRHAWPLSKLSSASCAAHACTGRAVTVTGRHGPSRAEPLYGRARRLARHACRSLVRGCPAVGVCERAAHVRWGRPPVAAGPPSWAVLHPARSERLLLMCPNSIPQTRATLQGLLSVQAARRELHGLAGGSGRQAGERRRFAAPGRQTRPHAAPN